MYNEIKSCRICGNTELIDILKVGHQALTGIFPKEKSDPVDVMPLELVKCADHNNSNACGLVQLRHTGDLGAMYGMNYGYRSGLNKSMVNHLRGKVARIRSQVQLQPGDLVIDIGSNDSTLLQAYPKDMDLVGIDPTGVKFKGYYPQHIRLIPEFFSEKAIRHLAGNRKAKVITSISMFYDLEVPMDFMRQIYNVLADDGLWVFEQSYLPAMIETHSYDTICHEHLEYYGLKQIKWMVDRVGFKIVDLEFNATNGGSFSISVSKKNAPYRECTELIERALRREVEGGYETTRPFDDLRHSMEEHREKLLAFLKSAKSAGQLVLGYGASTKGNVLLQYCGIDSELLPAIAEVNEAKFGCFTPGTLIPIISEREARERAPDFFLVLPWHFRSNIISRETEFLRSGGRLVFPLPHFEIVDASQLESYSQFHDVDRSITPEI